MFGSIEYFTNAADEVLFAHPRVPDSISEEAVDALFDWAERANLVGRLPGGGKVRTRASMHWRVLVGPRYLTIRSE